LARRIFRERGGCACSCRTRADGCSAPGAWWPWAYGRHDSSRRKPLSRPRSLGWRVGVRSRRRLDPSVRCGRYLPMNLRLVELKSLGPGVCAAVFETGFQRLSAEFQVEERDGIETAAPTPDIFVDFDGSATELRQIVAAIVAFCHATAL